MTVSGKRDGVYNTAPKGVLKRTLIDTQLMWERLIPGAEILTLCQLN